MTGEKARLRMVGGKTWAKCKVPVGGPEELSAWSSGESPRLQLKVWYCQFDGVRWSHAWLGSLWATSVLSPRAETGGATECNAATTGGGDPRRESSQVAVQWSIGEVASNTVRTPGRGQVER